MCIGYFSHILHLDIIKSQIESENEQYPSIWFSMGKDHSNPYIHTTVLCDTTLVSLLFDTVVPTSFKQFNENDFTPWFHCFLLFYTSLQNTMLFAIVRAPPHFAAHGHVKCRWVITRKWQWLSRSFTHPTRVLQRFCW